MDGWYDSVIYRTQSVSNKKSIKINFKFWESNAPNIADRLRNTLLASRNSPSFPWIPNNHLTETLFFFSRGFVVANQHNNLDCLDHIILMSCPVCDLVMCDDLSMISRLVCKAKQLQDSQYRDRKSRSSDETWHWTAKRHQIKWSYCCKIPDVMA